MNSRAQVSLLPFNQELCRVIDRSLIELEQRYVNLHEFLRLLLFINTNNSSEEKPANIIRIEKKNLNKLIASIGQLVNLAQVEIEIVEYIGVINQRLSKLKQDPQPKNTFIDRYGANIYFAKIILLVAILISFLNVVSQVSIDIKQAEMKRAQQERQSLDYKVKEITQKSTEILQAEKKIHELLGRINALQKQSKADKSLIAKITADMQGWRQNRKILQETVINLSAELNELTAKEEKRKQELQFELDNKIKEIKQKNTNLLQAESKIQELLGRITALQKQSKLDKIEVAKVAADLKSWQQTVKLLKATISNLSMELNERIAKDGQDSQSDIDDKIREIKHKNADLLQAEKKIHGLLGQINTLQKQSKIDKALISRITVDMQGWQQNRKILQETVINLSSELNELKEKSDTNIRNLNDALNAKKAESDTLLEYLKTIVKSVDSTSSTSDVQVDREKIEEIILRLQEQKRNCDDLNTYKNAHDKISMLFPQVIGMSID